MSMRNKLLILLIFSLFTGNVLAQNEHVNSKKYTILLSGASFASPENGWFELGCRELDAKAINSAIGGEAIADAANRMNDGSLYSQEELEEIDALVIMQVHNRDVADESCLRDKYTDYKLPFNRDNYAIGFDYVIKRYLTECYELRNNPKSKYYKSKYGKPALVVLCTHWNDNRTLYNTSVRLLAEKWGFPLVEFDKYIGFSKRANHPVTNEPVTLLYASDMQKIEGVLHGHHPLRGENEYIQRKMAAIFVDMMHKVLPVK